MDSDSNLLAGIHSAYPDAAERITLGDEVYVRVDSDQANMTSIQNTKSGEIYQVDDLDNRLQRMNKPLTKEKSFNVVDDTVELSRSEAIYSAIMPILHLEELTDRDLEPVALKLGVSKRQVRRYVSRVNDAGGPKGLIDSRVLNGRRIKIDSLESIIEEVIQQEYINRKPPLSVPLVYDKLIEVLQMQGVAKRPSKRTFYRRVRRKETGDPNATKSRHGHAYYDKKFGVKGGTFRNKEAPLAVVMIDSTKLDVMVIDENGTEIGRPWLTVGIDLYSRAIWSFYLSFEHPDAETIGLIVLRGALKKDEIVKRYGISSWDVYGVPEKLHFDNAMEFRAESLTKGCLEHGIVIEHRPVKRPEYGAYIERFFKTLNMRLVHAIPGTTFSNVKEKGEYDSSKEACLTLPQLEEILVRFIVEEYQRTVHSGIKDTPEHKWKSWFEANEAEPMEPNDRDRFRIDFLPYVRGPRRMRVIERDGVHNAGITYWAGQLRLLQKFESKNKKRKYQVRYDPTSLRFIYIYDDKQNQYYKLESKVRCTEWEWGEARKELTKAGLSNPKVELVLKKIKEREERLIEMAASNKKAARRVASSSVEQDARKGLHPKISGSSGEIENTVASKYFGTKHSHISRLGRRREGN